METNSDIFVYISLENVQYNFLSTNLKFYRWHIIVLSSSEQNRKLLNLCFFVVAITEKFDLIRISKLRTFPWSARVSHQNFRQGHARAFVRGGTFFTRQRANIFFAPYPPWEHCAHPGNPLFWYLFNDIHTSILQYFFM